MYDMHGKNLFAIAGRLPQGRSPALGKRRSLL